MKRALGWRSAKLARLGAHEILSFRPEFPHAWIRREFHWFLPATKSELKSLSSAGASGRVKSQSDGLSEMNGEINESPDGHPKRMAA